jgi:ArsR family transcriptional regulator, cadmium/lead-responsive transcriptional repressor
VDTRTPRASKNECATAPRRPAPGGACCARSTIQAAQRRLDGLSTSLDRIGARCSDVRCRPPGGTGFHEYSFRCTVVEVQTLTHTDALARFGHALSDTTRTRILLNLSQAPSYPADLADRIGVSRQTLSNHLACLRGCGLVVAVPEGRRTRYELADARIGHALGDLMGLVLAVDPNCRCVGGPDGEPCACG